MQTIHLLDDRARSKLNASLFYTLTLILFIPHPNPLPKGEGERLKKLNLEWGKKPKSYYSSEHKTMDFSYSAKAQDYLACLQQFMRDEV